MLYEVKVIKVGSGFFKLSKKIKNVEADVILDYLNKGSDGNNQIPFMPFIPRRNLIDVNKNSYEINLNQNIVIFSKERDNLKDISKFSRIPYTAKYKHINGIFWGSIKNVVHESLIYNLTDSPIKVFITQSGERWEVPCINYEFKFDREKMRAIQDIMEQESGQKIGVV